MHPYSVGHLFFAQNTDDNGETIKPGLESGKCATRRTDTHLVREPGEKPGHGSMAAVLLARSAYPFCESRSLGVFLRRRDMRVAMVHCRMCKPEDLRTALFAQLKPFAGLPLITPFGEMIHHMKEVFLQMKRQLISLLLVFTLVLGMFPMTAWAVPSSGGQVYQIGTAEDLLWFAEAVNDGQTTLKAELTADIDLSDVNWPGIGTQNSKFAGSFDGNGHTVTFQDADWGLLGYVMGAEGALVSIQNVTTSGSIKRSGIAQDAGYVQFTNCVNRATITAQTARVGGILGVVNGTNKYSQIHSDVRFINCGNEASVTGFSYVGGILGHNAGAGTDLDGCYNTGNIHGSSDVGGLVGYLQGSTGTAIVQNSCNTGRVTGSDNIGGIVGYMKNGGRIVNCFNAGSATYAMTGNRYNNTATITNSYFLGTASAKCSPDYTETMHFNDNTYEITSRATAVSAAEMATAGFATLLGTQFVQSCPYPVLSWQEAKPHTGAVCDNCKLGSTEKEVYDVTFQQHDGYTLSGDSKATQDSSYSFTITISEGYEAVAGFAVKANGETVTAASDGKYTVLNVKGPVSVTVLNVQVIPGSHSISLPGEGYGYRVQGDKTVKRDENYSFRLTFVDGFKAGANFQVIAQEILPQSELDKGTKPTEIVLNGQNGTYTIPTVQKDYRILVSGVAAVSKIPAVTVNFTVTEGWYDFHVPNDGEPVLDQSIEVPYFDLSLYGLEKYYYNPYCYLDADGTIKSRQEKGTPESAYDVITVMHAFIVATELFYLGMDPSEVGTGTSDPAAFGEAISWSQDAGSSFMNFWDHGTNLNYYVNYEYPLAYAGWGATSDQIAMKDGNVISVHLITGQGSGSNFGFFVANDDNGKFKIEDDLHKTNQITLDQGQKVKLTYYWTSTSGSYATKYVTKTNQELYWIYVEEDGVPGYMKPAEIVDYDENGNPFYGWDQDGDPIYDAPEGWHSGPLGKNAVLKTDANGMLTIDTTGLQPGTYYIGAFGGFTGGGQEDNGGFVSTGSEAGCAFFKIVVKEYNGKLGDVDGDTEITAYDALLIQQYVAKLKDDINHNIADVDGDGEITAYDALLIQQYVAKIISTFPVKP